MRVCADSSPPGMTLAAARKSDGGPRGRTGAAALLALGVFAVTLLVVPGTVDQLDGQSMLQVTRSMVEHGDVTVSGPVYGVAGLHGQWYSKYGPGQSVAAVPLYLAGRAAAPLLPADFRVEAAALAASLLPALATAVTAALVMLTATELGASSAGGLILALIYTFSTPAIVYATLWFSEPLTGCMLLAAVYVLIRDRQKPTTWGPLIAGVSLAVAVATRIEAVLFVPPCLLYVAALDRRRASRLVCLLLPLVAALFALGHYNAARFGSPWDTGYSGGNVFDIRDTHPVRSLTSVAEGVYGLLVSPGKGLVEYAPITLLAPFGAATLWARRRAETLLLITLVLIDLIAHANILIRWLGGWSWGPRFLIPVLPLVLLLTAPLLLSGQPRRRIVWPALAVLALLGILVQVPAVLVHEPQTYIYSLQPAYGVVGQPLSPASIRIMDRLESDYVNQPRLSPIVGSWRILADGSTWTPPRGIDPTRVALRGYTFAPHTWWRMLYLQGATGSVLYAICAFLVVVSCCSLAASLRLATLHKTMQRPPPVEALA